MRLLALAFLIIGNLSATQAFAEDVAHQPLTRKDCDIPGMTWDDTANVSAATSEGSAAQAGSQTTNPVASTILINIDKTTQKMTVSVDGAEKYRWPVSTGKRGYTTPSGTFKATSMNEIWYSKQWDDAPMPHSIFFTRDGHAIHGSYETKRLGHAVSHGCVRLAPKNASTLYALVEQQGIENTTIVISGGQQIVQPRQNQKSAQPRQKKRKPQYGEVDPGRLEQGYAQPQRRCGLFRRRWCGGQKP